MAFRLVPVYRITVRLLLGMVLTGAVTAQGEEMVGPPEPPLTDELMKALEKPLSALDSPRDYLSSKLVGFVSEVDQFFADERHYQETNDSVFQLDLIRVMGYGGEHKFVLAGRANVHLPVAEKKLHLLLESDPDKNASVDPRQAQSQPLRQPAAPQSYGAALRFIRSQGERWHFSADGGLKFQGLNTTPFVRSRASLETPLADWRLKVFETVFWFNTIGAGETTQFDMDHAVSKTLLFRSSSIATWLHDKQNFDLRQDFTAFHTLDERTALLYQASVIGVSQPVAHVTDYVLLLQYRYKLHKDWMFFDLGPQLHFPQERSYSLSPQLGMRLEMMFDESNRNRP